MTTPIDQLKSTKLDTTPVTLRTSEVPTVRKGKPDILLEHPGADVQPGVIDYCEVMVPLVYARQRGLVDEDNNPQPIEFLDTRGRRSPACIRKVRGFHGVVVDVVYGFVERFARGELVSSGRASAPLPASPFSKRERPRIMGFYAISDEEKGVETQEGFLFTRKTVLVQDKTVAIIVERGYPLSPVSDVEISFGRHKIGSSGYGAFSQFPGGTLMPGELDMDSDSSWRPINTEWGTLQSSRLRVIYESEVEGPISYQIARTAHLEPAAGLFQKWRDYPGAWGPLGVVPESNEAIKLGILQSVDEFYSGDPSYQDARPFSQNFRTLDAGAQRFGVSMNSEFLDMSPVQARQALRCIAEDEALRPVHWLTPEGEFLTFADRPGFKTFGRVPHDRSIKAADQDKVREDFGGWPSRITPSGRWADDGQHTDDLALHAYLALFDDSFALEMTARQIVERDAADRAPFNGWSDQAGRGEGRPGISQAWACWLFGNDDPTGFLALQTMRANMATVAANWEAKGVALDRPVKPYSTFFDNRQFVQSESGEQLRSFSPYEHATMVAWLCAYARLEPQDDRKAAGLWMAHILADSIHAVAYNVQDTPYWRHAYVVGLPGGKNRNPKDWGKRPPAEALVSGNAIHELYVTAEEGTPERDPDSWNRWTCRASALAKWIRGSYMALTGIELGSQFREQEDGCLFSLALERLHLEEIEPGSKRKLAELHRMNAVPLLPADCPFTPY